MELEEQLKRDFDQIVKGASVDGLNNGVVSGRPCTIEWRLDAPSSAISFDGDCISCVRQSAQGMLGEQAEYLIQEMISGAGKKWLDIEEALQHD